MGTYTALPNLYLPSQPGAPLASGITDGVGELITLLDAILVDGYGSVTLDSLEVASEVATATVAAGHGFVNVGTYGPVVQVAGATPSGLDGNKRITVTSSTTFTFAAPSIADGTATGTITAKMAPAGWTKEFSDTNKAVYRPASGLRHYLWVDDTVGISARARGFVSMTDIDTGADPFPTDAQVSGGGTVYKSSSTTARAWVAVADERHLYLLMDASGNAYYYGTLVFGQCINALPGDAYCSHLNVPSSIGNNTVFGTFGSTSTTYASWIPRGISQTGTAVQGIRMQMGRNTTSPGISAEASPPACGFRRFGRAEIWDSTTVFRGWIPGVFCTSHFLAQGTVLEGFSGELAGRTLYTLKQGSGISWQMDITGPWFDD